MTEDQITVAVAAKMFPSIQWETQEKGYLTCPGLHLHTSSDGRRDCRITINDGMVPTIYCCHNSCSGAIAQANHQFRSAIGKLKTTTAGQLGKIKQCMPITDAKPLQKVTEVAKTELRKIDPEVLPQPIKNGQALHLATCFNPEELVGIVLGQGDEGKPMSKGTTVPPIPLESDHALGTVVRVNPMAPGGAGDRDVTAYRHCLIECDTAPLDLQWSAFLESKLPISVVVSSGGRSVHGWVKVDASNEKEFRERAKMAADAMEEIDGIKVDRATLNPSRLSRLAGCARGNNRQELLAVKLGAANWDDWLKYRQSIAPKVQHVEIQEKREHSEGNKYYYRKKSKDILLWEASGKVMPISMEVARMFLKDDLADADKSAVDAELKKIIINRGLDYDGPLPGYRIGVHEERGSLYFCDSQPKWLDGKDPADATMGAGWETIYQLMQGLFVQGDNWKPFGHFIASLKQSRECLRLALQDFGENRQVRSGQATVLCGPKACGKSFILNHVVAPLLGGRSQDAHKAFSGDAGGFNGELLGGEVWVVDDKEHASDIRTRKQFASNIKSMLYSGLVGFHAKHKTQISLRPFARLFILCNDQDDAIKVLPPLTVDIEDKIHLFRCGYAMPAMATEGNAEWTEYGRQIRFELPAFAGWLDQYEIPSRLLDARSGVSCYQDPYVVGLLASQSPEWDLGQLLVYALERGNLRNHSNMTSRMILDDLRGDETTKFQANQLLHDDPGLLGRYLGRINNDARRYERDMGLKIERHPGKRGIVEWEIKLV
jgi:hypothetical protein